jgi:universal stress protein E
MGIRMTPGNSILVIIDPTSQEQPALGRAAWIGTKLGFDLELFVCEYDQYLAGERFFDSAALDKARSDLLHRHMKRLEKLASPLREQGLRVTIDVAWDHPLHEGILRKIERANPNLVLKDTHFHSAIRRSVFSNTDWHLIRDCTALLWLVKPYQDPAIKKLLAAVDPLHERDKPARLDHKILETAERIRAAAGAELDVVHGFDPAPAYAVSTDAMSFPITEPINDAVDALRSQHQAAMDELVKKHPMLKPGHAHLMEGETREVLVGAVDDLGADLVVIGAVSRTVLKRLVLGSTAERVLDFVPCDLLIVKPD